MYRIALLVWLWGVWGLLLAIPILGIVKVVSHHIEELDLVAELLKKCWRPSIRCRAVCTPSDTVSFNRVPKHHIPDNSHVPTEFVVSGYGHHHFCADVQIAAARPPTPDRINFLNR